MDARILFFTVVVSVFSCSYGYPIEGSEGGGEGGGLTDSVVSSVKGSGEYLFEYYSLA